MLAFTGWDSFSTGRKGTDGGGGVGDAVGERRALFEIAPRLEREGIFFPHRRDRGGERFFVSGAKRLFGSDTLAIGGIMRVVH